jgi:uncharacterized 2Fe-2S/4Fe-4S cluster protein (DUF4445 family)
MGYALACQTVVEGDLTVVIPPQEKIERRLTSDRTVGEVVVPAGYNPLFAQTIRRIPVTLNAPSLDDQTDDWGRLLTGLRQVAGIGDLRFAGCYVNQYHPSRCRMASVSSIDAQAWDCPECPARLIDLSQVCLGYDPYGEPLDIGTTTVTLWLVDLITGQVRAQVAEYNG